MGHSHLVSMTMGKVLWDTLTPNHLIEEHTSSTLCRAIGEIQLTKQGSQPSN